MKRESGVLMHISALPGEYGCGSFGEGAKGFIDFLADAGMRVWQVLPFGVTDGYFSPYKSVSAFAGNPYFIDLPSLFEAGLLSREELDGARQKIPYACEVRRLQEERVPLLFRAAGRVGDREPILAFLRENPEIAHFARYMALWEQNGDLPSCEWTVTEPDDGIVFGWGFIEYTFFSQWERIKRYANERGIEIIGDIPMYVSEESADVFYHPELFDLDGDRKPKHVAGVPPDYFAKDGQLWGNPLYRWDLMKEDGYRFFAERIRCALTLFDRVRIDHFRAIESYWEIPRGAPTAKAGKWKKGPGKALIAALDRIGGKDRMIAEDLGEITPAVRRLIASTGYPGMRVLQFAFDGDPACPHLPCNYPENVVAYTGTHDNNTLLGYIWEIDPETRRQLFSFSGYDGDDFAQGQEAVLRTMLASHANTVIFPIQDLLGFGSDCRMNTPGRAEGNWAFRVTREQIAGIDRAKWRAWNRLYAR